MHDALFAMSSDSVLGSDSFRVYLFQIYWDIIKDDVIEVVVSLFINGLILPN